MSQLVNPVTGQALPDTWTPAEVAAVYRVDPKTVTRWARAGRLTATRLPGGHRRYPTVQFMPYLTDLARAMSNHTNTN